MRNRFLFTLMFLFTLFWLVGCQEHSSSGELVVESAMPQFTATPKSTATPEPTPTPAYEPVFETADCQFYFPNDNEIRCGYLVVPEDRSNPEQTIRLHVAVVPSTGDSPAPDPVVYLSGGPGGHALTYASFYASTFSEMLRQRDLIIFDQHGIGFSEPSLNCPEVEEARLTYIEQHLETDEENSIYLDVTRACRDRLIGSGINLSAYNSAASAADLDDLRRALGYEVWNIYGVSYGSRLALTAMRDYGDTGTIRSVVLGSVYSPQVLGNADLGLNADRAFILVFDHCAAIENCNNDYPNLKTRFYQLVDDLNNEPMTVIVTNRADGTLYRVPFDGDDLIYIFFRMMYNSNQIIRLPKMISQLEGGTSMILTDYLNDYFSEPYTMSEGMNLSVQCYEEAPTISEVDIQASVENLLPQLESFFTASGLFSLDLCATWQVDTADPLENEPVVSDIPTLILAGQFDPITPPYYGTDTAEFLSQSFYFEFKGLGHGVVDSHDCGKNIMIAFLAQPDVMPDDGCMQSLFIGFVPK